MLKLTEAGFYLDQPFGVTAIAAYFTYGTYIVFGVIIAIIFTDGTLSEDHQKKSAFSLGVLAPSIILALASQPIADKTPPTNGLEGLRSIGSLIVGTAYAQPAPCSTGTVKLPDGRCFEAELLKRNEVEPSFAKALQIAVGRSAQPKKYAFVVGVAKDADAAKEAADNLNGTILQDGLLGQKMARVIVPEGTDNFFVTIGTLESRESATTLRRSVAKLAVEVLKVSESPEAKSFAAMVLDGRLVDGQTLLSAR
ncbi:MAG: hypothetical protein HN403_01330 [Rhodospirillales bacterium]|nr:hypothetical protein [Rhodospirillales bacterium]